MRIEYLLRSEDILSDLRVFKENLIHFQNVHEFMTFEAFLDALGNSTILIWDGGDMQASMLEFKGAILKFCFDFRAAINKLVKRESSIEYVSGSEQGEFNFSCIIINDEIVINVSSCERKYCYHLPLFLEVFEDFYVRVLNDFRKYYTGIEKSPYWKLLGNGTN